MRQFKVLVEKTATAYSAYCDDQHGVISSGSTWEAVKHNFTAAFVFHLEGLQADGEEVPPSYKLDFSLDVAQLFEYYKVFDISALADYLKLSRHLLQQYKEGRKTPSEVISLKILKGLHSFGQELLSVN